MARCVCPRGECKCKVVAGVGVQVKGVGSENQPFAVASAPGFHSAALTSESPVLDVNAPMSSEVGTQVVFAVEIDPGVTGVVHLPEGTSSAPAPVVGAELDFLISGAVGSSAVAWSGAGVTWMGSAPSATAVGWYRFTFTGRGFIGQYVGASRL